MMEITFKDGAKITTNKQADFYDMVELGHELESIKFVPGERYYEPEPKDERIVITFEYMIAQVKETRKIGQAKLNTIYGEA